MKIFNGSTRNTLNNEEDLQVNCLANKAKILKLSEDMAKLSDNLSETSNQTFTSITQVVMSISEVVDGNNSVSQSIQELNRTNINIVNSVDEINNLIKVEEQKAKEALAFVVNGQNIVREELASTRKTSDIVKATSISVNDLKEMANNVLSIVGIITSIAGQTNLIALNAAIESARAGEYGRGFSVVSSEIKKLSESSNIAAKNIAEIISKIIEKVNSVDTGIDQTLDTIVVQESALKSTEDFFQGINTSLENISQSVSFVSSKIEKASSMSKEITEHSKQIASVAQQTATNTSEILGLSEKQIDGIEQIILLSSEFTSKIPELIKEIKSTNN